MIAIIAAIDNKFGIGLNNTIPWHYPEDLKFFKETTNDSVCVMGRNTFESMKKHFKNEFLPNRHPIVISSSLQPCDVPSNVKIFKQMLNAIFWSKIEYPEKNIFLIGGNSIYEEGLIYADTIYLNRINNIYDCDTFFPRDILAYYHGYSKQALSENVTSLILKKV